MGWQTESVVQLIAGDTIINPNGAFTYSAAPAAGNLIASIAPASGTDSFGNKYLQGVSAYGASFAASLNGGFVSLYSGSLAAGWTLASEVQTDALGDLILTPASGRKVLTPFNTLDDGVGNATITGTLSVNGSTSTSTPAPNATSQNGLTNGQIAGTSGAASAGTAHTHGAGNYAVTNGQHTHDLQNHLHAL